jgi:DNA-binding transcriptional MerR regulator
MLQQLELFNDYTVELLPQTSAIVVRMPRKLVPPAIIMHETNEEPKNRAILKEEAAKINGGNGKIQRIGATKQPLQESIPALDVKSPIQQSLAIPLLENEKTIEFFTDGITQTPLEDIIIEPTPAKPAKQKSARKTTKTTKATKALTEKNTNTVPDVPEDEQLYTKRYYSIGEVAAMFKVNTSLIRFWESEFDTIKPHKNGKGDRLFTADDVKNIQLIYNLLKEKKYTIEGAKDYLQNHKKSTEKFEVINQLQLLKQFLQKITLDLKKT